MNIETAITNAIGQMERTTSRALARVTYGATINTTPDELDRDYTAIIEIYNRTVVALRAALLASKASV